MLASKRNYKEVMVLIKMTRDVNCIKEA